jgi:hypothetical protein
VDVPKLQQLHLLGYVMFVFSMMRVFENRALRRIFGRKGAKCYEVGEDCIMGAS